MTMVRLTYRLQRDELRPSKTIPVIWSSANGPLESLIRYFVKYSEVRSQSWMDKVCLAVETFLEYVHANSFRLTRSLDRTNFEILIKDLFEGYVACLYSGTLDANGIDVTNLCWRARRVSTANGLIIALTQLSDWLATQNDRPNLNPLVLPSGQEERLFWAAFENRLSRAFKAHLWSKNPQPRIRRTFRHSPAVADEPVHALGLDGFNIRETLITILQHFGGIRTSEAFHLYVYDVDDDESMSQMALSGWLFGDGDRRSWYSKHSECMCTWAILLTKSSRIRFSPVCAGTAWLEPDPVDSMDQRRVLVRANA